MEDEVDPNRTADEVDPNRTADEVDTTRTAGVIHRLQLLRHAKSSWDDAEQDDHDRPLAPRGHRAVAALRHHLAGAGGAPDLVLCSTARRAVATWEGIRPAYPDAAVEITADLYGASAGEVLQLLQAVPGAIGGVLVVGHNPTMGDLAHGLVGSGPVELRAQLSHDFPTGALATFAVAGPWSSLDWAAAHLRAYVVPRDLPDPPGD